MQDTLQQDTPAQAATRTMAAEKTCFLHIGPHKTGTTSIQGALFANADRLAEIGLHYPTLTHERAKKGRQRRNHTPLGRPSTYRTDDLKTAPFWSELSRKISDIDGSIVVSTEHFADVLRDKTRCDRVVDFFRRHGFRIVVVAYVRDQPGWLNSWYTQYQRNFIALQTFGEFLDDALESGLVDPHAYLRRFIEDEQVEVRVASFDQAVQQGFAANFLATIGAPADFKIEEAAVSNPNLGVKGLYAAQEIMRRLGAFRIRTLPDYQEVYDHFRRRMQGRDWEKVAYVGVTPEDEKRIRDHYRASNDAFARRWLGADWETVCPPKTMTLSEFDFASASEEDRRDVTEIVDEMVAMIAASRQAAKGPGGGRKPGGAGAAKGDASAGAPRDLKSGKKAGKTGGKKVGKTAKKPEASGSM